MKGLTEKLTTDERFLLCQAGKMFLVWAYHDTEDLLNNQHSQSGGMEYTFIPLIPTGGDGDDKERNERKGSSATYFPSLFGITSLLLLQFVIGG